MDIRLPSVRATTLEGVVGTINNILRIIETTIRNGPDYVQAEDVSNATVGLPFRIHHNLGHVPSGFAASPYADCRVWATTADRAMWSSTEIFVRCSVASARVQLTIFS